MFKAILKSIRKSRQLKKVSKHLSQPIKITQENFVNPFGDRKKYLDELVAICESDEQVKIIMDKYDVDGTTLKKLYNLLAVIGAGQYAGGHFVVASSIAYPKTLKFLLEHYDGEYFSFKDYDHVNSQLFIAHRLIQYFERREAGDVKC